MIFYQEKVSQILGSTLIGANRIDAARFRVEAGEIQTFDVWRDNATPGAETIFQVRVNGVEQFDDEDRPVLAANSDHVGVTGLTIAVEDGDVVSVDIVFEDSLFGFALPAYFRFGVEQETPLGPSTLAALTDVEITTPADNQVLTYDNGDSKWKNEDPPGGSTLTECFIIAVSDETTNLTAGNNKIRFRMPYAFTVTEVRASLSTASGGSGPVTVDINEAGSTILSTKITIDDGEKTSTTAATPPVISDASLADDAEITIDIDDEGSGAKGLKVYIIGNQ